MNTKAESWMAQATRLLVEYARNHESFTSIDAFEYAHGKGLAYPASATVYGPVFKKALIEANLIVMIGMERNPNPQAHGRKVARFRSVIYKYDSTDSLAKVLADLTKKVRLREMDVSTALKKAYEFGASGKTEA